MPEDDALPDWARSIVAPGHRFPDGTAALDASVALASESARHGGGPFGAVVTDGDLRVVAVGWNRVIEARDSTAHAEVVALRRAQARLGTHDLGATELGPLTLWGSCAPCIQCAGALYWSGIARVVTAARAEAAEALGFQEGPVTDELWETARRDKGLVFQGQAATGRDPEEPFRVYRELGGSLY